MEAGPLWARFSLIAQVARHLAHARAQLEQRQARRGSVLRNLVQQGCFGPLDLGLQAYKGLRIPVTDLVADVLPVVEELPELRARDADVSRRQALQREVEVSQHRIDHRTHLGN